ncbi:GlxA family transcriptional regulator [Rhodococcus opacus]|uniref:Helix-turn-helix domain-containing protein n=1 Tax=Rhodococcus opacus TaxID=37919 RepID=A0AAX3YQS8_RHOOP|nr:helix-turn-helix domain-containing protein [Rhodococcus opacus]MCZ4588605.1 helix-turn-helix domain-containing protein [Rhodococcus opacus]UZG58838.1 helix-turn-helix domain-containing protein [Rhodococcus opacus]WLF50464.1 helix-turn-helix domain-containing protein [Rhodococcus opacus]
MPNIEGPAPPRSGHESPEFGQAVSVRTSPHPHRVAVLVYDGVKLLDVAGPAEVFAEANRCGADYQIVLLSPTGAGVASSIGIKISVDGDAGSEPAPDTFLVAGGDIYPRTAIARDLVEATGTLATRSARVGSIRVEPDSIYVRDGTTYTSAGVSAGIDLALALVEEDHGPDLTRDVARRLVVYLQRAGGQSQFSAPLQGPPPRTPALRRIVDLVTADPAGKHSLAELAGHLNVSPRHLTRLFRTELSTTPAQYVELVRFDMAKALLDQGHNATQAASLAGFPSYESLRRVFVRELSMSPAACQRRFGTAHRADAG